MEYICIIGFVIAFVAWIVIAINVMLRKKDWVIPMWTAWVIMALCNIGIKFFE